MRSPHRAAGALVVCALLVGAVPVRAECEGDDEPPPPPVVDPQRQRDAFGSLVAGLVLFSVGTAVQSVYFAQADTTRDRFLARMPLVGPIAVVAGGGTSPDWSSALAFSSVTQLLGVVAISIAIPRLLELRTKRARVSD